MIPRALRPPWLQPGRGRRIIVACAGVLVLYALVGSALLPWWLRSTLERRLSATTGSPVTVGKVALDPFTLRASIHDFSLSDTSGSPVLSFSNLTADLQLSSLWRWEWHFAELALHAPRLHARRQADASLNLLSLMERAKASLPPPATNAAPSSLPRFRVDVVTLTNGMVSWHDHALPKPFAAQLEAIHLSIHDLSSRTGALATVAISAQGDGGERVRSEGTLSVEPAAFQGALLVDQVALPRFRPYADPVSAWSPTSGVLRAQLPVRATIAPPGLQAGLVGASLSITDLTLIEQTNGLPVIFAESLDIANATASLEERNVTVGEIRLSKASLHVRRVSSGETNLRGIIEPEAVQAIVRNLTDWQLNLGALRIEGADVDLVDHSVTPEARIRVAGLKAAVEGASNASNAPPARFTVSTGWCDGGEIRVSGSGSPAQAHADARIELDALTLPPLDPYLAQFARLRLGRGFLSADLHAAYGRDPESPSLVRATGKLSITDVAALDPRAGADFIRWDAVEMNGIDVGLQPNRAALAEMVARKIQTSLILNTNGQVNVLEILQRTRELAEGEAPAVEPVQAPAGAEGGEARDIWPVTLGAVRIDGLSLVAADSFYAEGFRTTVESIDGEIRNLHLPPQQPVAIDLRGRLTALSGFTVAGEILPDPERFGADLRVTTDKAELAQFTPYSLRFAGYPITRGQLTADVRYRITDGQLQATNDLRIDQFTLGSRVDHPDALKLPLKLGVALLKDRNGQIHLNLPLSGSMDDPQFRIAPVLWQVIRNVILKAATAPFALLGSLFGSKEDLEFVEFDAGSAAIPSSQTNRLATLAAALLERPQLQLEILPAFDAVADRQALARARLESELLELKVAEAAAAGISTNGLTVAPEERPRLLAAASIRRFGAALSPVPTNQPAPNPTEAVPLQAPPLPAPEELEQRLVETVRVEPDQLKELARSRAVAVEAALTNAIPPERVSVLLDDPENPGIGKARVTFRLQ